MAKFHRALRSHGGRYDGRSTRADRPDDRLRFGNRDRSGDDDQASPHGSVIAPDDKSLGFVARSQREFDRSLHAISLKCSDGAIGQQQLVALALPDHESNLVDQKFASFRVVVDFAGVLEIVQRDLDRAFCQQRSSRVMNDGHGVSSMTGTRRVHGGS